MRRAVLWSRVGPGRVGSGGGAGPAAAASTYQRQSVRVGRKHIVSYERENDQREKNGDTCNTAQPPCDAVPPSNGLADRPARAGYDGLKRPQRPASVPASTIETPQSMR